MDCSKMRWAELRESLRNPHDTPIYIAANAEREYRLKKYGLVLAIVGLLVSLLSFLAVHAKGQQNHTDISDSGNRYAEVCASTEKPTDKWNDLDIMNASTCQGFMLGINAGVSIALQALKKENMLDASMKGSFEDFGACVPDEVVLGQMTKITLKYIRENPEQAHLPSAELVILAQAHAFPCPLPKANP